MVRDKVRIRFRKTSDLRLVSHHDLMRCWERMLRRAALPFHSTAGFNPKPRLVFALSLGLGIVGSQEVAELELDDELPPTEILERLRRQAPPGLDIVDLRRIAPRAAGGQVRRIGYRIALDCPPQELTGRVTAMLAAAELWVERDHPLPRRLNLRPYLDQLTVGPEGLVMVFHVTPTGTVRPAEILVLLGLGDLLPGGAVLERFLVELHDEVTETTKPNIPLSQPAPDAAPAVEQPADPPRQPPSRDAAQRPQPLLPGPLDF